MKYEFIFKIKEYPSAPSYDVRYRCVVAEARFNSVKSSYEKLQKAHPEWLSIILINKLSDDGEFIEVIQ